jgi:hypothetical protein
MLCGDDGMKALTAALIAAALLSGCGRRPQVEQAPEMVAIKAGGADLARLQGMAAACGAAGVHVRTIENATFLVVGTDDSIAARDCFYTKAQADYRAQHPVKAWIEDAIG